MKKYICAVLVLLALLAVAAGCDSESHELVKNEAKAPSCTEDGHTEYWTCVDCSKIFADAEGQKEISVFDTFLSSLGHRAEEDDGTCLTELKCSRCDEVLYPARTEHVADQVTDCTLTTLCKYCPTVMILGRDEHESGVATCVTPASCIHCGMETGELDPENHAKAPAYIFDDLTHSGSYPCCGEVISDMVDHHFVEGFCICGVRQAHPNTIRISKLPNANTIKGWVKGDELLITVTSELFGRQPIIAVYDGKGNWQMQGEAFWAPGEKVNVVTWYAPGFTFSEAGEAVAKPGDAPWKAEYLLASSKVGTDNLVTVDFASSVRSYSVFSVKTVPNTKVHVAMYNFKPTCEEKFLEGIMPDFVTDENGMLWFYGTFAAGGRYVICNDNGDTLVEQSFPTGTNPGQYYAK